ITDGKVIRVDRRSVAEVLAKRVLEQRPEQLPELPVAARLRAAAPIFHSPNNSAGVVLDDKRLWLLGNPGMAAALKRLNNSKSRTVSDSSWASIPRGGSLG